MVQNKALYLPKSDFIRHRQLLLKYQDEISQNIAKRFQQRKSDIFFKLIGLLFGMGLIIIAPIVFIMGIISWFNALSDGFDLLITCGMGIMIIPCIFAIYSGFTFISSFVTFYKYTFINSPEELVRILLDNGIMTNGQVIQITKRGNVTEIRYSFVREDGYQHVETYKTSMELKLNAGDIINIIYFKNINIIV